MFAETDDVLAAKCVSSDEVPPFSLLNETGQTTSTETNLDVDLAKQLYGDMIFARRLDREALALQRQGQLHLWLMAWGQEAAQVGSIRALRDSDMVFPSYRDHAAALSRGIAPADLLRQWKGLSHSGWDPTEHSFHIYSLVLGTQTLHATGYAAGVPLDQSDEVVLTYFGDGATSQGDVNEAMNWAAASSCPVIFFCQNNQWAISTPTSTQMKTPLHVRASGFGLASYHVDGNDALAVHAVTKHAAEHVRAGNGPAFIEARTYRLGGHSSSDDPKRYRDESEIEEWQSRDPIERLRKFLRRSGVPDDHFTQLDEQEEEFASTLRRQCHELEGEGLDSVFAQTYSEPHPVTAQQLAQYTASMASEGN